MAPEDRNRQAFLEEAQDLLTELESALLELEGQPSDHELIDRVFRAMHTIKGSGAMFGFDDIAAFTHDVETIFDLARNGTMPVTKPLLDMVLQSKDHIQYLLQCSESGSPVDLEKSSDLTQRLRKVAEPYLGDAAMAQQKGGRMGGPAGEDADGAWKTFRIRFKPHEDTFHSGTNPMALLDELSTLGRAETFVHINDTPLLEDFDAERCYAWWDIILNTPASVDRVMEVFLFIEDSCDLSVQPIDLQTEAEGDELYKKLGEILVERGDLTPETLEKIIKGRRRLGEDLVEAGVVTKEVVSAALAEQRTVREFREAKPAKEIKESASSIRVAAEKLDTLVDLVGELVIVQARISQVVTSHKDASLAALAEELERLSNELRDSTLGIRMLPIGTTFSKFRRLVRDLSAELGKEIELTTKGAETELDKTVIERLNDPLVHLLRNSIDHGVELPAGRLAAGKPVQGTILIAAEHSGGDVLITIADDGGGIDPNVIRAKAIERGLISADAELSDKEVLSCIFMPGFSTAQKITNISGRGVGLDVVKRAIDQLRGSVDIQSSKAKGTTFSIKLPLTLAIIDGLQVVVGDEFFVIPLNLVEECLELIRKDQSRDREQRIVNLRGEIVPYIRLRECFEVPGVSPAIEQIVVVGVQGARMGVVVDNVIGEHQTVIKSLGRVYRDVEGISGATIRGDGAMALILDIPKLVQSAGDPRL